MKKSISLLLAAVMVFALAAIACADATTVTAWISDGAETVIYTSMFDDFNSKHDDIQVDYQFFAQDELLNKLQTAPIVGDTPDLIVIDGLQIPYFQDLGMIACLDNYIDEDMKNDVLPSVWSEVTYDGGLYGVAQFDSGMAMWTRKSILEKIGARIPTSYKDAWTVEEFEDILAKCKEIGYEYPLYIRQNKASSLYFTWMAVIASFGGDYLNRDTMLATGTMDGENTVAAYEWMKKMLDEGYITNVAVRPDCRRRGVAGKLLDVFERFAEGNHLAFLSLEVRASNYAAIALYGQHGYRGVGRRRNYYEHPKEDAVIMTREFGEAAK